MGTGHAARRDTRVPRWSTTRILPEIGDKIIVLHQGMTNARVQTLQIDKTDTMFMRGNSFLRKSKNTIYRSESTKTDEINSHLC
jgi:hypothetical protein